MHVALLVVGLIAAPPQPPDASVIAGFLAHGAASDPRADVLTSADLRNAFELEAQRQLVSCDEDTSCLAEIAQALDANVVLSSTMTTIDDEWVVQVSAFDVRSASSVGRRMVRADTQKALTTGLEAAGRDLIVPILPTEPGSARFRVLVLDATTTESAVAKPAPPPSQPWGGLVIGGAAVAGVGVIATGIAITADVVATTPPTTVKEGEAALLARTVAGIAYPVGVGLIVVGVGLVLLDGVLE